MPERQGIRTFAHSSNECNELDMTDIHTSTRRKMHWGARPGGGSTKAARDANVSALFQDRRQIH